MAPDSVPAEVATKLKRVIELVPRPDRSRAGVDLDTDVPTVVLYASQFPLQHGCLGVYRTLGRAGVPVYAVVAERRSPVARSRYVTGKILWKPHRGDTNADLIERLIDLGRTLRRRSLIVCIADEMALLVASHRTDLEDYFILPAVAPELPVMLSDKKGLSELGRRHGVAAPRQLLADSMAELEAVLDEMPVPVVVKTTALRGQVRNVDSATVVGSRDELLDRARGWQEPFSILLQECIPDDVAEDWFTHGYCDTTGTARVVFTGRKVRCWPVRGGSTAAAYGATNPELAGLASRFCAAVGYRGAFDIDWRLDRRDGSYNLLDFNPRVGAQFRLFENDAGIDVVRAMHLDLSGRPIPSGKQIEGERFIVEPWNAASLVANPHQPWPGGVGRPRATWWANDDPAPVVATGIRQVGLSMLERLPGRR
ncbi:MAG: ATP-grasp domain-containing protein [Mycobacterium sp.]|nr:ATP-grasp domain-containing protein [Mycobacterium sp.]